MDERHKKKAYILNTIMSIYIYIWLAIMTVR